jgi:predicted nucleic acid-binding protein
VRLVADANVLLSAVIGGRAALVLRHEQVVERSEYEHHLPEAKRRIGKRDPDDVDVLALALDLNLAVWSNDSDFEDAGVEWQITAELLKALGIRSV